MPIIVALSGEHALDCDNVKKHGIPKNRDQYLHFNAKQDQWHYWTKLSYAAKAGITAEHKNDGRCVLCIIDGNIREM
jgi:hypothetical protein